MRHNNTHFSVGPYCWEESAQTLLASKYHDEFTAPRYYTPIQIHLYINDTWTANPPGIFTAIKVGGKGRRRSTVVRETFSG